ncbi:MAG: hypothetical protein ACR2KV_00650 [Solirubrobacteraceae bacterium]
MLNPARRWALRELKIHPGHTVVVAGAQAVWTVELVRELVTNTGSVIVIEDNAQLAAEIARRTARRGWTNVNVRADATRDEPLARADRAFFDNPGLVAEPSPLDRILRPLGPAARVAAVCTRGTRDRLIPTLERHVHVLRSEGFYLGAAFALWGQLP